MANTKLRFILFTASIVVGTITAWLTGAWKYWLVIYEANPFMAIFGTGLFVIMTVFTISIGMWNKHIFWVKRKRANILEKTDDPEEIKTSRKKSKMLDGLSKFT